MNKLSSGPLVPFTTIKLPTLSTATHGDVIVFSVPTQPQQSALAPRGAQFLVKRVVGIPNDTLWMRNGVLHVNALARPQAEGLQGRRRVVSDEISPRFSWQKQVGLAASRYGAAPSEPTLDNWGPLVVPANALFVLGDNRLHSTDSRYFGFVSQQRVVGKLLIVYLSFAPADDNDANDAAPGMVRLKRIGRVVR